MTIDTAWPVPFILDPRNLAIDSAITFVVSALLALMVNAEAQAFASTFLGDQRIGATDRFNFNAFLHVDILGAICFLAGGFGWPRTMQIDRSKFAHPRLYTMITRLSGPLANLLLASIGGTIVTVIKSFEWDPRVFLMLIGVNVTTAIYNLLPLPPLAMGAVVAELIPSGAARVKSVFLQAGPFLVVALVLWERFTHHGIISPYFDPLIKAVFAFLRTM